jgi:hypothetical protein
MDPIFDIATGRCTLPSQNEAAKPAVNPKSALSNETIEGLVAEHAEAVEPTPQPLGEAWLEELREAIANNRNEEALIIIDSMPAELQDIRKLGKGMVVLPDAEHMTEEMIDATRGLHLYYSEGGSGVTCEHMRLHLRRYAPWSEKHWPVWFAEENDYLTKAGRAIVAHALTVGAFNDPLARPKYFEDEGARRQRIWDRPMHRRIGLTFVPQTGDVLHAKHNSFTVKVPFIHASLVGENEFVLQLNRTDIPKEYRKMFKQLAVTVKLTLVEEGTRVEFGEIVCNTKESVRSFDITPAMEVVSKAIGIEPGPFGPGSMLLTKRYKVSNLLYRECFVIHTQITLIAVCNFTKVGTKAHCRCNRCVGKRVITDLSIADEHFQASAVIDKRQQFPTASCQ